MAVIEYRIKGKIASKEQWNEYIKENTNPVASPVTKTVDLSITLPNGVKLEGPKDTVVEMAKNLGFPLSDLFPEKDYYNSSSKGYVKYSDMDSNHLMNVAAKQMTPWIKDVVKSSKTGAEFLSGIMEWRGVDKHQVLLSSLFELKKRT